MLLLQTHHHLLLSLLLFALSSLPTSSADGISCHGSKQYCSKFEPKKDRDLLLRAVLEIPDTTIYPNGQNIACLIGIGGGAGTSSKTGGICIWVWNTDNTTTGATVKKIAPLVPEHGCKLCGNAPIVQDGSNDVGKGMVTWGWSWNEGGCDGACDEYGESAYLPGGTRPSIGGAPDGFSFDNIHDR